MEAEPIIEIRDLSKHYGSEEVLKGINLDIHKGQIIGYIGPNGAGKSTTVKILLGIVESFSGSIKVFGKEIDGSNSAYKLKVGYVPESGEVYDALTAYEYLSFVGGLYNMEDGDIDAKGEKLMDLFDIKKAYHSRISTYSKGMRQKLLIIASLIHNPDILFLDEPLNGLDANSVMVFKEILADLARNGKTIFYSSHIMEVVEKISSRIILINQGRIVADGTFEELKQMSKEGSLEGIFNQLTGFNKHSEIATEFVNTIQGV